MLNSGAVRCISSMNGCLSLLDIFLTRSFIVVIAVSYSLDCPDVTISLFFKNSFAAWCGMKILSFTPSIDFSSSFLVTSEYRYKFSNTFASTINIDSSQCVFSSSFLGRKWPGNIFFTIHPCLMWWRTCKLTVRQLWWVLNTFYKGKGADFS